MNLPSKRHIALWVLAIGCTTGCGTKGELGSGSFTYGCADKSDITCDVFGNVTIPATMARGSSARISFHDSNNSTFVVTPAAPRLATVINGEVVFHEAGVLALIAKRGELASDFTHVSIALVDHFALTSTPAGSLPVGQSAQVTAKPIGPAGEELAGALAYTWTSADPTIATVTGMTGDHRATVTAKAAGTTTIQASAGGVTSEMTITVQGTP